jgi:hypothetical protein
MHQPSVQAFRVLAKRASTFHLLHAHSYTSFGSRFVQIRKSQSSSGPPENMNHVGGPALPSTRSTTRTPSPYAPPPGGSPGAGRDSPHHYSQSQHITESAALSPKSHPNRDLSYETPISNTCRCFACFKLACLLVCQGTVKCVLRCTQLLEHAPQDWRSR